ncbi:NADPH-dependent curcumin reductase CurA [Sphingobium sp. OAS761]|uniref:hypothetical protein n=1 Tax=Sphingobium sp. OAS761 TaxID=2817901 RepID=UPI0020A22E57|nr:hypothetical protein [Sphingobium sp. OAS761]MCP1470287.1 NADPH-dependent curcumin reductase CurA [Sphingobium sp. OAS761]
MTQLWKDGGISVPQTIFEGLESAPEALAACISGDSPGAKILVRVSPDTSRS